MDERRRFKWALIERCCVDDVPRCALYIVISAISEELFDHQPESYRNSVGGS